MATGLLTALWLLLSSLAIGCVLALLGAIALTSGNWVLRKLWVPLPTLSVVRRLLIQVYLI